MRVGDYEVRGEIARGASGVVLRATDSRSGEDVALKVLLAADASPQARRRFHREAEALMHLNHPALVSFRGAGEQGGRPYLVMSLIQGQTLHERMARGAPYSVPEAVELVLELSLGLAHAHELGVVHRDIKPSNICLRPNGQPVLTDFGLAKDLQASMTGISKSGLFLGSPGYWPPEQAEGDLDQIGPHSDVYSLGATLYELLTGRPPIGGQSLLENVRLTKTRTPRRPSRVRAGLDARLDAICMKCLAKAPSDRYRNGAALAEALEQYQLSPGIDRKRSGVGALAGAAAGLLALAALLVVVFPGGAEPERAGVNAAAPAGESTGDSGSTEGRGSKEEPGAREDPGSAEEDPWDEYSKPSELEPEPEPEPKPKPGPEEVPVPQPLRMASDAFAESRALQEAGDQEGSARALDETLRLDPTHVDALLTRGTNRYRAKDMEGALEDYQRFLHCAPQGHPARGVALTLVARLKKRASGVTTAPPDALDPGSAQGWRELATRYEEEDNLAGAIEAYGRVIGLDPEDVNAYTRRGTLRIKAGDKAGGLADYERWLELNGSAPEAGIIRGQVEKLRRELGRE